MSPAQGISGAALAALEARGSVDALIASGGHDLGQPEWQTRYPDARTLAPAAAVGALAKKKALRPFEPISALQLEAGSGVTLVDAPGSKVGSIFALLGGVRYIDEIVGNHESLPPHWMFSLMFRATGSAPGVRLNRVYTMMFASAKKALARAALDVIEGATCVVFAHGPPLLGDDVELARVQLRRLA